MRSYHHTQLELKHLHDVIRTISPKSTKDEQDIDENNDLPMYLARVCARPVSPVTMRHELSSVSEAPKQSAAGQS